MELKDLGKGFPPGKTGSGKPDVNHDEQDSATEKTVAESVFPDEETKRATEKAMSLLLHKDRTENELLMRLKKAGFSYDAVIFASEYVKRYGYIDDLRYATSFVELHCRDMSRRQVKQKLVDRGISDEIISEAFSACESMGINEEGVSSEEQTMTRLISKRLRGRQVSELTYEEKQKHMRYLAGKGFPTDMIRRAFLDGRNN